MGALLPMAERMSRQSDEVLYSGICARFGNAILGLQMPLAVFDYSFQKYTDERRFERLARLLGSLRSEIGRELAELCLSHQKMTDCAAFTFEAMESGEPPAHLSATISDLTRNLAFNQARQTSLEQQLSFVDWTRARLKLLLSSNGA